MCLYVKYIFLTNIEVALFYFPLKKKEKENYSLDLFTAESDFNKPQNFTVLTSTLEKLSSSLVLVLLGDHIFMGSEAHDWCPRVLWLLTSAETIICQVTLQLKLLFFQ